MPRKQYINDFQSAQGQILHPSISDICKGDEDGSFTFLYTAENGQLPVEITAIIPDVSDYPSAHQYFLCAPDGCATAIMDVINSTETTGVKVADLLKRIGQALDKAVVGKRQKVSQVAYIDLDEEMTYDEDDDEEQGYDEDEDEEAYDDEDVVSDGGWSDGSAPDAVGLDPEGDSQMDRDTSTPDSERWRAFCHDLRAVKRAGYKVGVLGHLPTLKGFISVSIKVAKLGISDEAMTAWRLDPNRYLVLLLYFPGKYKGLNSYMNHSFSDRKPAQFCVGVSDRYKPTYDEAIDAFTKARKQPIEEEEDNRNSKYDDRKQQQEQEIKGTGFEGVFISRPLCELLNERFFMLLKYRMIYGLEWEGAERFYDDFQGRERIGEQIDDMYYTKEKIHRNLSALCLEDELQTASKDEVSLPLIAMQFMLRHFVRCTEFCLVCHTKVQSNFEALKPYVCSKPLCLYQYMALGFGPSMEYEILSQPSVVDLLISFCYASASGHKLRDFPVGLNLKVLPAAVNPFLGVYNLETQQLTITQTSANEAQDLRVGDWIMMTAQGTTSDQAHCRVIEVDYYPKIKVAPPIGYRTALNVFTPDSPSSDNIPVQFSIYQENFDKIDDASKRNAVIHVLETLPSVNEMRAWLQKNKKVGEQATLGQWKNRMSQTACNLLRWIIASNRSCILQIDETPEDSLIVDPLVQPPNPPAIPDTTSTRCVAGEERVWGMSGWVQFRFAMGAPDKEQRFVNEVAKVTSSKAYPTLFAWHGSPIHNWHSIIREGLHFKDTAHGRAFGHGCYHSLDLNTSLGYCGRYYSYGSNSSGSSFWPKSHLKIDSALCLNEIVNAPEQFVSKSPHLVVAQLDWIQTRYLFVKSGTGYNSNTNDSSDKPLNCISQDPSYTPRNTSSTHLIIPEAVSASRARQINKHKAKASGSKDLVSSLAPKSKVGRGLKKIGNFGSKFGETITGSLGFKMDADYGYATDETDEEDVAILFHDDNNVQAGKGKEVVKPKKVDPDAFVPGTLDLSDIQLLAPPEYATNIATKRLQNELKTVLKLQSQQELSELGWYINGDLIENVYQWIIELHSFDKDLPLAQDMKKAGIKSVVMEARFGKDFPMTPPFIRVIRPRFLPFQQRGGGHVTAGGALCMELLTNSGWSAVSSMEAVLLQIRMAMSSTDPFPARLEGRSGNSTYSTHEAKDAFVRACRTHGWTVPPDFHSLI